MAKKCSITGCGKPHHGKGYCTMHHTRLVRHGDPNFTKGTTRPDCHAETLQDRIKKNIKISKKNNCWLWQLAVTDNGFGYVCYINKTMTVHRAAYEAFIGKIPAGLYVHHICGNKICCNPEHLFLDIGYSKTANKK